MNTDFQCELKLKQLNKNYSELVKNTAVVMANVLDKYTTYFPTYTDHSSLHALQVIDFCNKLIGDQIDLLNEDELFVLLMGCYMHDTGMGISDKDYQKFHDKVVTKEFIDTHPNTSISETIRMFHHEFSGQFIRKYAPLFEIPTQEHVEAIVEVSRGHRKTNLFSSEEYPIDYKVPNGNTVCLPYLAALIRLADELDIAADINVLFTYDESNNKDFLKHASIKHMEIKPDCFELTLGGQFVEDPELKSFIYEEIDKLQKTLDYCREAVETRTKFKIYQKKVVIK